MVSSGPANINSPTVAGVPTSITQRSAQSRVREKFCGDAAACCCDRLGKITVASATPASTAVAKTRPLGLFLNDALGNAFENTPGVASGKGPYVCGSGSCVGVNIYETQIQVGANTALTYAAGDLVYAAVNGYLTNRIEDAYETALSLTPTIMGVVKAIPDATNPWLVIDLRV